jgi:hypothetical protein
MLAGTDLALAFNDTSASFEIVDCARVHALSISTAARSQLLGGVLRTHY